MAGRNNKPLLVLILLFAISTVEIYSIPFPHLDSFVSQLSDRVNQIKRALIDIHSQPRTSSFDTEEPLITDRFVSRDPGNIRFLIYDKRLSPSEYKEVRNGDIDTFSGVNFVRKKPVKILIHGFNHNGTEGSGSFPVEGKNAYLENTDHNVIIIDWGMLAKPTALGLSGLTIDVFYPIVVSNVPRVGEEIGKFLVFLMESDMIDHPDQIHLLGFSLGAHVAGHAGAYVKDKTGRFIGRISGLDPAGPMFEEALEVERLDKTDADFVDVYHSSRLGLQSRLGHVDFFVNGGRFQADCYNLSDRNPRQTISDFYKAVVGSCGHSRAPLYFFHTIKKDQGTISGCGCSSWREYLSGCKLKCKGIVEFGEHCPPTARGMYFLEISVENVKE